MKTLSSSVCKTLPTLAVHFSLGCASTLMTPCVLESLLNAMPCKSLLNAMTFFVAWYTNKIYNWYWARFFELVTLNTTLSVHLLVIGVNMGVITWTFSINLKTLREFYNMKWGITHETCYSKSQWKLEQFNLTRHIAVCHNYAWNDGGRFMFNGYLIKSL